MRTITAGDFTIEYEINKEMWAWFKEKYDDDVKNNTGGIEDGEGIVLHLKRYLRDRVGEVLTDSVHAKLGKDKDYFKT